MLVEPISNKNKRWKEKKNENENEIESKRDFAVLYTFIYIHIHLQLVHFECEITRGLQSLPHGWSFCLNDSTRRNILCTNNAFSFGISGRRVYAIKSRTCTSLGTHTGNTYMYVTTKIVWWEYILLCTWFVTKYHNEWNK